MDKSILKQEFLDLLKFKTISNNLQEINKALDFVVKRFKNIADIHFFENNHKKSILIVPPKTNIQNLDIILNAHIDVVNAPDKQFVPIIKGDKIYARGAYDMKSGLYAGMLVIKELLKNPHKYLKTGLQIVPDEEIGGFDGTLYQLKQNVKAKFAISLEPTDFDIAYASKGVFWFEVTATGKNAHAAYPWNGKNAIHILNNFINNLDKHFKNPNKETWATTYNLSQIGTNNNTMNQVPNKAYLKIDMRYIQEDKQKILDFLKKQEKILNITIKRIMLEPAVNTNKDNKFIKKLANILINKKIKFNYVKRNGSSDLRHFARFDISGIEFGPKGNDLHGKNEYVEWSSILQLQDILLNFLKK